MTALPSVSTSGLVVELCGLPGSGKTTLAHEVVARLRATGGSARVVDRRVSAAVPPWVRVPRKAGLVAGALARAPVRAVGDARLLGGRQPDRRDRLAVPVQWLLAGRLVGEARRTRGTAVLEEGLVQALWTAALRARTPLDGGTLARVASRVPRAHVVVHLDVPVDLALSRLRGRSSRHSRVQRQQAEGQLALLEHGDLLLRELLGAWSAAGLGEVLLVDGAAPDVAGELLGRLPVR
ncbi:MAG TPA: hypothetical protein VFM09_05695 [Marmoricola sp.]|nr:hypothetical protein [Marmoricola sp.]